MRGCLNAAANHIPTLGRIPKRIRVLLAEASVAHGKLVEKTETRTTLAALWHADPEGISSQGRHHAQTGFGQAFAEAKDGLFADPKTSMLFGDARQSPLNFGGEDKNV